MKVERGTGISKSTEYNCLADCFYTPAYLGDLRGLFILVFRVICVIRVRK